MNRSLGRALPPLLFAASFWLPLPTSAAPAHLVADIGAEVPILVQEANTYAPLTVVRDGIAYFAFDDGIHGRELWCSDGTRSGTRLLADLCPGSCGMATFGSFTSIASSDELVFFAAQDGVHGSELWVSDGTTAGTRMIRDIRPGLLSSQPNSFTRVGDRVFFTADDGENGNEPWISDGTSAGTRLIANLGAGSMGLFIEAAADLNGNLVFGASFQNQGPDGLWRSDGTAAGTVRILERRPRGSSWLANPAFAVFGGELFFSPSDGNGLWTSDGTPDGTVQVFDRQFPGGFVAFAGQVYFVAFTGTSDPRLYRTDGTTAGTSELPLPAGVRPVLARGFGVATSSLLYFTANDSLHGAEPWATDGTSSWMVSDIRPGPDWSIATVIGPHSTLVGPHFAVVGDDAVFFADDGVHGRELWRTDGTSAGTALIGDLTPGAEGSLAQSNTSATPPVVLNDTLLFRVESQEKGKSLWRSDGTAGGTAPVSLIGGATSAFLPSAPELRVAYEPPTETCFSPFGNGAFFSARDGMWGSDVWISVEPGAGTYRVLDLPDISSQSPPRACRSIGGRAVFTAGLGLGLGSSLAATDGTIGHVEELLPNNGASWLDGSLVHAGRLFIAGNQGLWSTDGTTSGTRFEGAGYALDLGRVGTFGDRVVLSSGELFAMDPESPDGTLDLLADLNGAEFSWPRAMTTLGSRLLFFAWTAEDGQELRMTTGGPWTTRSSLLRDIRPGRGSGVPDSWAELATLETRLVAVGARAVFSADDGVAGEELWVTDGTPAGTVLLADLFPGPYPSTPRLLTPCGDRVCFVAESPGLGRELWRTNGLPGGTHLVADLVLGTGSSVPEELTAAGSDLYFSAWTPGAGREPWRLRAGATTGQPLAPLADVAPGPLSSSPLAFLEVGGRVYFPANDNVLGFELWSVQEPDSVFSDGFESSGTAVWSQALP